eukprot:TRINITY_DN15944_c0_g1_i1.p1 TRINITY_DN15944_c0_g1~~TRINITY_DN15944_c0_g1_i1.p1  ORF type:complete len:345 (-),score=68.68 TRINITY_DN15944_c0_g1_i1:130-1164(-)
MPFCPCRRQSAKSDKDTKKAIREFAVQAKDTVSSWLAFVAGWDVQLKVSKLDGSVIKLLGRREWRISEVKAAIADAGGFIQREQRLVCGTSEVKDDQILEKLLTQNSSEVNFTMLRRSPLQAEWLEKVAKDPISIKDAPVQILEDKEVVLAAGTVDCRALEFASWELWEDVTFVQPAIELNWRVWLQHVPPCLKDRRDVVLTVLKAHGRALQHVSKDLCRDPDVIQAAMHTRPSKLDLRRYKGSEVLETLMKQHVEFVFRFATPDLRHNRDFMLKVMQKDWLCADYAAPELWADRTFAIEAVKMNCDLLKRVAEPLRGDPELIRAVMAESNTSMEQVARELCRD